ncbi:MAG: hypothetical protein H6519_11370 [Microthrixaceae bacterium]|nr:hypothetical protein [Acidimicrobiales bacterium]MCB9405021.1 hypothetical protein [Microthrixaceae bacterium]
MAHAALPVVWMGVSAVGATDGVLVVSAAQRMAGSRRLLPHWMTTTAPQCPVCQRPEPIRSTHTLARSPI